MDLGRHSVGRIALCAAVGGGVGAGYRAVNGASFDGPYFTVMAHRMLGHDGLHVYAAKGLQSGPLQLLWFALIGSGWLFAVLSGAMTAAGLVLALRYVARQSGRRPPSVWIEAGVLALGAGWGVLSGVYAGGHPAELVVPALWAASVHWARQDRLWPVVAALGVAAGFETWALLALPLVALFPQWRRAMAAGVLGVAAAASCYLPFAVAGPFRMDDLDWPVNRHTLVHALAPGLTTFGWGARMAQTAAVIGVLVLLLAMARRWSGPAQASLVWLAPAVIVLAKIASDPQPRDYYWVPLQAAVLIALAAAPSVRGPHLLALPALVVSLVLPAQLWPVELGALALLVASAVEGRPGGGPDRLLVRDHGVVVSIAP